MTDAARPPMRLAYITSMKRGLPAFIHREVRELRRRGVEVLILGTRVGSGLYMPEPDWPVHSLQRLRCVAAHASFCLQDPQRYFRSLWTACRTGTLVDFVFGVDFATFARSRRATSVHCKEGLHSLNIGYYVHSLLDLPLSVTIYADSLYIAPSRGFLCTALDVADTIITICQYNRDLLVRDFGIQPHEIRLVPVHVDTDTFQPCDKTAVLIVGQFAERKGHEVLLRAVRRLNRADIAVWVVGGVFSGGGKDYVDVPGLVHELGLEDQVVLFGNVSDKVLRVLYERCDIFCLPSRFRIVAEGTPVALMEAMAFEKPVITTRHAGIPEYVEEVLVEEDDVEGLARAIAHLADHPETRSAQGKRNRKIIEQKFSEKNIDALIAVLREAERAVAPSAGAGDIRGD